MNNAALFGVLPREMRDQIYLDLITSNKTTVLYVDNTAASPNTGARHKIVSLSNLGATCKALHEEMVEACHDHAIGGVRINICQPLPTIALGQITKVKQLVVQPTTGPDKDQKQAGYWIPRIVKTCNYLASETLPVFPNVESIAIELSGSPVTCMKPWNQHFLSMLDNDLERSNLQRLRNFSLLGCNGTGVFKQLESSGWVALNRGQARAGFNLWLHYTPVEEDQEWLQCLESMGADAAMRSLLDQDFIVFVAY